MVPSSSEFVQGDPDHGKRLRVTAEEVIEVEDVAGLGLTSEAECADLLCDGGDRKVVIEFDRSRLQPARELGVDRGKLVVAVIVAGAACREFDLRGYRLHSGCAKVEFPSARGVGLFWLPKIEEREVARAKKSAEGVRAKNTIDALRERPGALRCAEIVEVHVHGPA